MQNKERYLTISQIDATIVKGPHQKELEDIGRKIAPLIRDINLIKIKNILSEDLGGIVENIGLDEDWSITLEFFPEVKIHISYFFYGDEFGDIESDLKILFSGKHVSWVPGEDLATYIDIFIDFLKRRIKNYEPVNQKYDKKSDLLLKVFKQRKSIFKLLEDKDIIELKSFLDAEVMKNSSQWRIKKEIFPEINIVILYSIRDEKLDISYYGKNLKNMESYHIELIAIFIINHILRFITIKNQEKKLPNICYMMFSRLFSKEKGWDYRNI
ncbi:MAG: hypothetical protein KGD63_11200 [Candidatus Lokiarchaeota archaeon]|nr:hypothetical protein [Candidatus Lokiarchaeota archaeon]